MEKSKLEYILALTLLDRDRTLLELTNLEWSRINMLSVLRSHGDGLKMNLRHLDYPWAYCLKYVAPISNNKYEILIPRKCLKPSYVWEPVCNASLIPIDTFKPDLGGADMNRLFQILRRVIKQIR